LRLPRIRAAAGDRAPTADRTEHRVLTRRGHAREEVAGGDPNDSTIEIEADAPVSFMDVLHRMDPQERLAAYRAGAFTRRERTIWAANYPEEVPLVNDELEWIALTMTDLDRT
jgi:hypothetical protein